MLRFLNNNDTGQRFVTRYGIARTRLAAAMLLTVPGLPLIYNGDEVGAEFEPYDEGPPITWTDTHGLRGHYARLVALRREHPALRSQRLEDIARHRTPTPCSPICGRVTRVRTTLSPF